VRAALRHRLVLAAVLLCGLGLLGSRLYAGYDLHVLEARLSNPNPVKARALASIEPSHAVPVSFEHQVVDERVLPGGRKPKVIINPDGRGNVVGAGRGPQGFALYPPNRPLALISRYSRGSGNEDAQAADLDGDAAPDIVAGGLDGITFILHNPLHDRCSDVYRCEWKSTIIDDRHSSHDVVVGDINHSGRTDIATESGIYFARPNFTWTFVGRDLIRRDGQGTSLADLQGDRILDVVAPYDSGRVLGRFVNPLHHGGDPTRESWRMQPIDERPVFIGNMTTAVADINGDGRNDIILAPMYGGGGLFWYEAPAAEDGAWRRHSIDTTVNFVHQGSLQIADFIGDGHPDIAFAEQDQSPTRRVGVFYNVKGDGSQWRLQVLSTTGGHNIKAGQLGTDRRPSIINARHGNFGGANPLVIWRVAGAP
jgi:hypothetical protein